MAKRCQKKTQRLEGTRKAPPERGRWLCHCKSAGEHMSWLDGGRWPSVPLRRRVQRAVRPSAHTLDFLLRIKPVATAAWLPEFSFRTQLPRPASASAGDSLRTGNTASSHLSPVSSYPHFPVCLWARQTQREEQPSPRLPAAPEAPRALPANCRHRQVLKYSLFSPWETILRKRNWLLIVNCFNWS